MDIFKIILNFNKRLIRKHFKQYLHQFVGAYYLMSRGYENCSSKFPYYLQKIQGDPKE